MSFKNITVDGEKEVKIKNAEDYLSGDLYGMIEVPLYGETGLKIYSELVKLSKVRKYKGDAGITLAVLEVLSKYRFSEIIKIDNKVEIDEPDFIVAR